MTREELIDEELKTKHDIDGPQMGAFFDNGFYNGFHLGVKWGDEHPQAITDTSGPRVNFDDVPDGAILTFGKSKMFIDYESNAKLIRDILIADNERRPYLPVEERNLVHDINFAKTKDLGLMELNELFMACLNLQQVIIKELIYREDGK